jgi:two-component system cell cycle sensor histidine kinase/response regulator CckA
MTNAFPAGEWPAVTDAQWAAAQSRLTDERGRVAALSLFARRVSHDMSNFATVVRTYSELLLSDLPSASATHADVLEIHRAADAMVDYMARIVRFARNANTPLSTVVLDDVLREAVDESRATCVVTLALESRALVRIEATWLLDAMREVLANAREASPGDGGVVIRSSLVTLANRSVDCGMPIEAGVWAIIECADDGAGFSDEVGRRALDPFVTTKAGVRGAGFGLAIARSAMWGAGGHVAVVTPHETMHTTSTRDENIRLWLPIAVTARP